MSRVPSEKLKSLTARWQSVQGQLSDTADQEASRRLSKEFAELDPLVEIIRRLDTAENERSGLAEILADPTADRDMAALAYDEMPEIDTRIEALHHEISLALLPKDAADERSAVLEVRAGTGGEEAALFAGDLFRMYQRYAQLQGWKLAVLSESESGKGGYREVVASVTGKGVFARMKFESGTHRVQRVPETETSGRIHTSAATVAVLPEAEEVDIEIRDQDIRIDTMRASGPGGQSVNTTDSAVRITHLPTGIMVTSSEKSQHQNRARAMQVLRARLYDMERQKIDDERSAQRKGQVGSGDRSGRIRTYNFPQGRVTDHRINLTVYNLPMVLLGQLDEVIDALILDNQAQMLADMANFETA